MIIQGCVLDNDQTYIATNNNKYIMVTAGAGSGKTLTILGRLYYYLNDLDICSKDILCISYTNAAASSLRNKIKDEFNVDIDVYTFHKLAMVILDKCKIDINLCDDELLKDIVYKYIYNDCLKSELHMKYVLKYFKIKYKSINKYIKFLKNNNDYINKYCDLICSFIKLYKCLGININDIKNRLYKRYNYFFITLFNIYVKYQEYLRENKEMDFDDLIINAKYYVKDSKINYKYIIVDEYQDTSNIRFNLLLEIINIYNSQLFVVGDDFQSIYGFSGCNIDLFVNFNKYFKDGIILNINKTYRNSQELIKIAGDFVMKNDYQIKKNLLSDKRIINPIELVYYKDKNDLIKLIVYIYKMFGNDILVLTRNKFDIDSFLNNILSLDGDRLIYQLNKDIIIKHMTVHKSKGLEANNVIIIDSDIKLYGFPNKRKEDKFMKVLDFKRDNYPFSEERRIFYVALTRTKNKCYLFSKRNINSKFFKEIKKMAHIKPFYVN